MLDCFGGVCECEFFWCVVCIFDEIDDVVVDGVYCECVVDVVEDFVWVWFVFVVDGCYGDVCVVFCGWLCDVGGDFNVCEW